MNVFNGLKGTRRLLELILQKLNMSQERMNELSREELLEIMANENLDLSWIASQESVDALTNEVKEVKDLVLSIAEKVGVELPPELPDECGLETDLAGWTYTTNNTDMTIDLSAYAGDIETLDIYPYYYINDNLYSTVFTTINTASSVKYMIRQFTGKNIVFHSGLKNVPFNSFAEGNPQTTLETVSMTGPCTYNSDGGQAGKMSSAFYRCTALRSVDLSLFTPEDSSAVYASGMFMYCGALTSVKMPKLNCESTTIANAFNGCSVLERADLTSVSANVSTSMGSMFKDCANLQEVTVKTGSWPSATAVANNTNNKFTGIFTGAGCSEFTYV